MPGYSAGQTDVADYSNVILPASAVSWIEKGKEVVPLPFLTRLFFFFQQRTVSVSSKISKEYLEIEGQVMYV